MANNNPTWWIYGSDIPHSFKLPPAPPWRTFTLKETKPGEVDSTDYPTTPYYEPDRTPQNSWTPDEIHRATTFQATRRMKELVNTALFLRRPLLITGKPGTGKSSLAYAVAYELQLGQVLSWSVTSHSTLQDALYRYDALGRLQDTNLENIRLQNRLSGKKNTLKGKGARKPSNIGKYIRLGPLGTALLPTHQPQVLLIDEIDKSSIDLPNELLDIFETGKYVIPELSRLSDQWVDVLPQYGEKLVRIYHGKVTCDEFPLVIMTSNGERDLPPPFLRRCIRLDIKEPTAKQLAEIIAKKFPDESKNILDDVLELFMKKRKDGGIRATDQLLNAIYLRLQNVDLMADLDDEQALDTDDDQKATEDDDVRWSRFFDRKTGIFKVHFSFLFLRWAGESPGDRASIFGYGGACTPIPKNPDAYRRNSRFSLRF